MKKLFIVIILLELTTTFVQAGDKEEIQGQILQAQTQLSLLKERDARYRAEIEVANRNIELINHVIAPQVRTIEQTILKLQTKLKEIDVKEQKEESVK